MPEEDLKFTCSPNEVHRGEMLFEVTADESMPGIDHIIDKIFDGPLGEQVTGEEIWHLLLEEAFGENFKGRIIETYGQFCTYGTVENSGQCNEYQQAKQFVTDYVWLCNQR